MCVYQHYKRHQVLLLKETYVGHIFITDFENASVLTVECIIFSKLIYMDKNVKSVVFM